MTQPRVSVICIFLNGEQFIEEAIESVLAQDYADWELLLVDDGSTDASTAIAQGYAQNLPDKISYLEHDDHANRGMSASRNLGLRHARGEFIAFVDYDDAWRPAKLREQLAIMRAHSAVGLVCGAISQRRAALGLSDRIMLSGALADRPLSAPKLALRLYPLGVATSPVPSDMLVRRSVVDRIGGFEDYFTGMFEDQAFLAKAYLVSSVWFSSHVWLDYRMHPQSAVWTSIREKRYGQDKQRYFEWYLAYLAQFEVPHRERLERAARRAFWLAGRPRFDRAFRRVRRLWLELGG